MRGPRRNGCSARANSHIPTVSVDIPNRQGSRRVRNSGGGRWPGEPQAGCGYVRSYPRGWVAVCRMAAMASTVSRCPAATLITRS